MLDISGEKAYNGIVRPPCGGEGTKSWTGIKILFSEMAGESFFQRTRSTPTAYLREQDFSFRKEKENDATPD